MAGVLPGHFPTSDGVMLPPDGKARIAGGRCHRSDEYECFPAVRETSLRRGELEQDMAKKSAIETNERRRKLSQQLAAKRAGLKEIVNDKTLPIEERFAASLKLAQMPRNSAKIRVRNRCEVTGRPRAYYRKLKMSRIALRELGSQGLVPGLVKSSW